MHSQIWCPMTISIILYFLNANILPSQMEFRFYNNRVCVLYMNSPKAPNITLLPGTNSLSYFQSCFLHSTPRKIMPTQGRSAIFLLMHLYRLCCCTATLSNLASFHLLRLNFIAFPNPLSFDVLS